MIPNQATADRVDQLDAWEFRNIAAFAAMQLDLLGFTYVKLQPGDSTMYEIVIVRPPMISQWERWLKVQHLEPDHPAYQRHPEFNDENRYFVAFNPGRLYGWSGWEVDPSYAFDKWTQGRRGTPDEHTACVIARFLTELAAAINERKERCRVCGQPDNCGDCNHFGTPHFKREQ